MVDAQCRGVQCVALTFLLERSVLIRRFLFGLLHALAVAKLSELHENIENQHAAHRVGHLDHGLAQVVGQGAIHNELCVDGCLAGALGVDLINDRGESTSLSEHERVVTQK